VSADVVYCQGRGLTEGSVDRARANAEALVDLERRLGLLWEPQLQDMIEGHQSLVTLANWIYIWGHWPFIIAIAAWLVVWHRPAYRLLRNAIFVSGGIGLVIFVLVPMMPPRMGVLEMMDTVTMHSTSYRTLQPPGFVNQVAAFPSLHAGFNLLAAIVLIREARSWPPKVIAIVMPIAMSWAVVVTANHYILDVVVGAAVALIGFWIAWHITGRPIQWMWSRPGAREPVGAAAPSPARPAPGRPWPGAGVRAAAPDETVRRR
jgi:membrane-associated phospholipid phosphatase